MTTIHAKHLPRRSFPLESMVAMASVNMPERSVRQQIASAISVIVQVSRMSDGTRKVVNISEITGLEETSSACTYFNFVRKASGRMEGSWVRFSPRDRPKFLDRLRVAGILLPTEIL